MASIDKITAKNLVLDINTAIAQIAAKHGLTFKLGTLRWDGAVAKVSVELHGTADTGESLNVEREWNLNCYGYGLNPEDRGRVFEMSGRRFKIVGCKPRATSMPILGEDLATGKRYKFSARDVARLLVQREDRARQVPVEEKGGK